MSGKPNGSIRLGNFYDEAADQATVDISYDGDRHLLIFGPNGSGKMTRFLAPNLLSALEDQSVIVIDPKGELASITADHRRTLGDVLILTPFNVLELGSAGFNPMAALDPDSLNFYDDAAAIAEALIKIEGKDPHWSESAQGLIAGLVMWEKTINPYDANLENIRAMLTEPNGWGLIKRKNENGEEYEVEGWTEGLRATARRMVDNGSYEIASLAARFMEETREIASIQSSADTQTRWLLSSPVREDIKKDGIDFGVLKKKITTVYVILPAERMRTHSVWLRLVIVSALRALYRPGGLRTVMLIDEFAALGHLAPLEDAFGLVRGYRVQIAAILQDLSQLKALYQERWETFIANAGVVFGFAPNDLTTAEWMSKRSGQTTVVAKGRSESTGESLGGQPSTSTGAGTSDQQVARPLFLPHELIGLETGFGLLWMAGLSHTVKFFAPIYDDIETCEKRAKPNPYYQK